MTLCVLDSDTAPNWLWAGSALVIKCTLNKVTGVIGINFGTWGYIGGAMAKYVIIQDMECTLDKGTHCTITYKYTYVHIYVLCKMQIVYAFLLK